MQGHCLCKQVTINAKDPAHSVGACHCNMCRRWSGGPFMEVNCGSEVEFGGAELISRYESSDWAERGFCKVCGTHLFYRLKEANQYMMPVGLFDDVDDLPFEMQVFIDEKPAYYEFANQTRTMTGAELFAMFAPPE